MNNQLARREPTQQELAATRPRFTSAQLALLRTTICPTATDGEIQLFSYVCEKTGLDPFANQIHLIKRWSNAQGREVMSIQIGADGYRLTAERTGDYQGQVGPQWCGADGRWRDVWLDEQHPAAARVGILRRGFREPLWGIATWASFAQKNKYGKLTGLWESMSDNQLAKCAEVNGLKRAFPQELAGLVSAEDIEPAWPVADPQAATRRYFAIAKGTLFETDNGRHDFVACYTSGKHYSWAEFVRAGTYEEVYTALDVLEKCKAEGERMPRAWEGLDVGTAPAGGYVEGEIVSPPAAPAPPVCAECATPLKPVRLRDGTVWEIDMLADTGTARYGKVLCGRHFFEPVKQTSQVETSVSSTTSEEPKQELPESEPTPAATDELADDGDLDLLSFHVQKRKALASAPHQAALDLAWFDVERDEATLGPERVKMLREVYVERQQRLASEAEPKGRRR